MSLKKLMNLPVVINAEVREGSLVSLDEVNIVEKTIGRAVMWSKVDDSEIHIGSYFQCTYTATLPYYEAREALLALEEYKTQNID